MKSESGKPASIADRLARYAKTHSQDHSFVLARYGIERLLWRISNSDTASNFILKGATLFVVWQGDMLRPTRDLDLLGNGSPEPGRLAAIFKDLCGQETILVDGLVFHPDSVTASRIRAEEEYEGVRVRLLATVMRTRIDIQVDIGFGDTVVPGPIKADFPTLFDLPRPNLWMYTPETVVAEKLQAIVELGIRTTRLKDFHDISMLLESGRLSLTNLEASVKATFERRRTGIPIDVPFGLSDAFGQDQSKLRQWKAFLNRTGSGSTRTLPEIIRQIREQAMPMFRSIRGT
ncbi:MAG: nucleotidyl transferase AbiEii/AbiGii toxin family protein [Fibrobacteres bacterium]|nr:nucleotidyl transferase AbiEii/AbiGii toxin family protein [Fibrobacterota bacterium]